MILILSKKIGTLLVLAALIAGFPGVTQAQSSLALSVSPTLFEMSAVPGQIWKSSVKIINSNKFPITVYGNPVNFTPQGEGGQGTFEPILEVFDKSSTLAGWIEISEETIEVPAEQSKLIEFIVRVPEDAPPGGHFAAILVGTQPPLNENGSMQLRTSQIVSSLFFLRIEGDVIEDGAIRSFSSANNFSDVTSADFELRFENKGNVHLRPKGSIEIFNMWGSERGVIPINQRTNFGNVLPESVRKFNFSWTGEQSFSDIGRFKAVASLAYGTDGRKFTSQTTYFWIVPIKTLVATLLFLLAVALFVRWSIKAYVRRMLALAGVDTQYTPRRERVVEENDLDLTTAKSVRAPITTAWDDFIERISRARTFLPFVRSVLSFILLYRLFFVSLGIIALILIAIIIFFADAGSERGYNIEIANEGSTVALNSEEVRLAELLRGQAVPEQQESEFTLELYNASEVNGLAAEAAVNLQREEYIVSSVDYAEGEPYERTVIVFTPDKQSEALNLSKLFGNALLSADSQANASNTVKIFIGNDYVSE